VTRRGVSESAASLARDFFTVLCGCRVRERFFGAESAVSSSPVLSGFSSVCIIPLIFVLLFAVAGTTSPLVLAATSVEAVAVGASSGASARFRFRLAVAVAGASSASSPE